ncbi:Xaa-Pro aminopeptidase [Aerococcaceae bacterium DSM 111176]|nr:Xaa-Pro aminopeptidase [Aerococcaceae bacterium DSM 111176]
MTISFKKVTPPKKDHPQESVILSDETYAARREKVLSLMSEYGFSSLVIYADKEHGSNFEYLTGFIPRFEEGLQILNLDGSSYLLLGNENANKIKFARVQSEGIKVPLFSLPNQPMGDFKPLEDYLAQIAIDGSQKIGFVDWKLLSNTFDDFHKQTAVPSFIVDSFANKFGRDKLFNATALYMHPEKGARVTNNAEEIARYEFGASLAGDALLDAMDSLEEGVSEFTAGDALNRDGQYPSVVTIAAFGERFINANIYPTENTLKNGDKVSLTVAYKGGLSSRNGYAVENDNQINEIDKDYLEDVVYPYFKAYLWWLQNVRIGLSGGAFFDTFNEYYPQDIYGWELCPGHLVADEEWLSSPFFAGSTAKIQSGNLFQVDFIPSQPDHHGVSCESTVAIADDALRAEIKETQPALWERIEARRQYLSDTLGIQLPLHVLPMTSTLAYYRPFLLDHETAIVVELY